MAVTIDYHKYQKAVLRLMENPQPGTDLYIEAAREASGQPDLELTPEQRRQCKQAAYASIYGMSGQRFIEVLQRTKQ